MNLGDVVSRDTGHQRTHAARCYPYDIQNGGQSVSGNRKQLLGCSGDRGAKGLFGVLKVAPTLFLFSLLLNVYLLGRLGGSVGEASDFGSGHDLALREFEPRVGLCADCSEPGACFRFCVSLSL